MVRGEKKDHAVALNILGSSSQRLLEMSDSGHLVHPLHLLTSQPAQTHEMSHMILNTSRNLNISVACRNVTKSQVCFLCCRSWTRELGVLKRGVIKAVDRRSTDAERARSVCDITSFFQHDVFPQFLLLINDFCELHWWLESLLSVTNGQINITERMCPRHAALQGSSWSLRRESRGTTCTSPFPLYMQINTYITGTGCLLESLRLPNFQEGPDIQDFVIKSVTQSW